VARKGRAEASSRRQLHPSPDLSIATPSARAEGTLPSRRALYVMDYSKFPSTSLVLMHATVLQAIAADDLAIQNGEQPPHQVRDTQEWQDHAKALEEEMGRRGVLFAKADFERAN
jgi:hypothetical protein